MQTVPSKARQMRWNHRAQEHACSRVPVLPLGPSQVPRHAPASTSVLSLSAELSWALRSQ